MCGLRRSPCARARVESRSPARPARARLCVWVCSAAVRPRLCATTRRPFASDVRACATGGGGRESVRRALRVRQATASPMICFSCERIPDSPRCHSFTLVDKGMPESALEMCGYRRKERIRSNPACTADLHTCELCSCECVRVCAVCAEVRASCASNLALGAGGSFLWPAHVGSESAFGGLGSREAGRGLAGQLCTGVAQALGRSL